MKFKATSKVRVRGAPSTDAVIMTELELGAVVESDEYAWKVVTLPDGRKGYCAAAFLEPTVDQAPAPTGKSKWFTPLPANFFKITQKFLEPDAVTYPKTGHHPGVDYGTRGADNIPLYFCADGEVIESGSHKQFGNYFFFYVSEADRTFVYFHLRDAAPVKGIYKAGQQCGITGKTGLSMGIHLHIECMKGRMMSVDRGRLYISKAGLVSAGECADAFIRARLK